MQVTYVTLNKVPGNVSLNVKTQKSGTWLKPTVSVLNLLSCKLVSFINHVFEVMYNYGVLFILIFYIYLKNRRVLSKNKTI